MLTFDHIAFSADTLAEGVETLETALGLPTVQGGKHALMGTHNRLMSLGGNEYLEVIAIDPDAPPPGRPRWFAMDERQGKPQLTNWICNTPSLPDALNTAPEGSGDIVDFERSALRWQMAVPRNGRLPFGGCFPAMIQWHSPHPAPRLHDSGARLARLTLLHPQADALRAVLTPMMPDTRIVVEQGDTPALIADIDTPHGRRILQ